MSHIKFMDCLHHPHRIKLYIASLLLPLSSKFDMDDRKESHSQQDSDTRYLSLSVEGNSQPEPKGRLSDPKSMASSSRDNKRHIYPFKSGVQAFIEATLSSSPAGCGTVSRRCGRYCHPRGFQRELTVSSPIIQSTREGQRRPCKAAEKTAGVLNLAW